MLADSEFVLARTLQPGDQILHEHRWLKVYDVTANPRSDFTDVFVDELPDAIMLDSYSSGCWARRREWRNDE